MLSYKTVGARSNLSSLKEKSQTSTMQYSLFFASFINCLTQEVDFPMDMRASPQTH